MFQRATKRGKLLAGGATVALAAAGLVIVTAVAPAAADVPPAEITAPFTAPLCAGETWFDPADQGDQYAVPDVTQVFGERLEAYNAGLVVPLYDSLGGSVLLGADGEVIVSEDGGSFVAYPALCGTRYVAAVGGPVSEWMFCTDRFAQTCGDTDGEGNLVDHDGAPVAPMDPQPRNTKLTVDQEKLIAYLVQTGHPYAGVGYYSYNDVEVAASDLDTEERFALQVLIWCVSDPAVDGDSADYIETCAANMDAAEQARLLSMIPDTPELEMDFTTSAAELVIGDTAEFTLTTNVFNQDIELELGGTATLTWTVCEGDATLTGSTLVVAGSDPDVASDIVICAEATAAGTATIAASVTPPSTQHIGWVQSVNQDVVCQVYATFHEELKQTLTSDAEATFLAEPTPVETTPVPTTPVETTPVETTPVVTDGASNTPTGEVLANTGASQPLGLAAFAGLLVAAGVFVVARMRLRTR